MADITMCVESLCPRKESCYRYRAIPESFESQPYSAFGEECYRSDFEYYIGIEGKKDIVLKK